MKQQASENLYYWETPVGNDYTFRHSVPCEEFKDSKNEIVLLQKGFEKQELGDDCQKTIFLGVMENNKLSIILEVGSTGANTRIYTEALKQTLDIFKVKPEDVVVRANESLTYDYAHDRKTPAKGQKQVDKVNGILQKFQNG